MPETEETESGGRIDKRTPETGETGGRFGKRTPETEEAEPSAPDRRAQETEKA